MKTDLRVIACNCTTPTSAYSRGALAYMVQVQGDRARVLVRSRGSRWILYWTAIKELANFRFKTIPAQNPMHGAVPAYFTDSDLAYLSSLGAGQDLNLRSADPDQPRRQRQ
jgi:hypothetical protein